MSTPAHRIAALAALIAALLVSAPAHAAKPHKAALAGPQAQMFNAMNAARTRNGLRPVTFSKTLTAASTHYARTLAVEHLFQHATRIRTSRVFSLVGEILARSPGSRPMIGPVVNAWVDSPIHRPILLGAEYQSVGLGMTKARYGNQVWTVWVVRFGKR
jgi:uncharacterized protein YkwD